jgi:amino acid transporter
VVSITTGIFTTYGFVLANSGPLGIWTWPLVIVGQLFVSLVFAALATRMPLAGYSYQWVSRLANPKVGWLIGWVSFIFLIVDVVAATLLCGILIEVVLAGFAWLGILVPSQSSTLTYLFSAATLLPAIIYLATVVLYIYARRKLPETHGFSLGAWEWPIIILSVVWLLFELSIFRDAQFAAPWVYSLVMFGIGLIYFVWMLVTRPKVLQTAPQEGGTETAV